MSDSTAVTDAFFEASEMRIDNFCNWACTSIWYHCPSM